MISAAINRNLYRATLRHLAPDPARPGDSSQGPAGRRESILDHSADVRDSGLQLRPAADGRQGPLGGPDAGGLPARLPGTPALLAPVQVHDLALPGDEEPRARRVAREGTPAD